MLVKNKCVSAEVVDYWEEAAQKVELACWSHYAPGSFWNTERVGDQGHWAYVIQDFEVVNKFTSRLGVVQSG